MITHTVYGEPRREGLHWYNGDVQEVIIILFYMHTKISIQILYSV